MSDCQHRWLMTNIEFGFIAFEKCSHCNVVRTHFSKDDAPGDEYRDGECLWRRVESAQSFRFDLICQQCEHSETYRDLMGLLYCTSCIEECPIEVLQRKYLAEKTGILVGFGFLPRGKEPALPEAKLDILTEYFNQRRDTMRSQIKIVSYGLIDDFSICKGEFIHDRGMLSLEPPIERKPLL